MPRRFLFTFLPPKFEQPYPHYIKDPPENRIQLRIFRGLHGADVHKGFNEISSTDGNHIQNPHIRNLILFFV